MVLVCGYAHGDDLGCSTEVRGPEDCTEGEGQVHGRVWREERKGGKEEVCIEQRESELKTWMHELTVLCSQLDKQHK